MFSELRFTTLAKKWENLAIDEGANDVQDENNIAIKVYTVQIQRINLHKIEEQKRRKRKNNLLLK